MILATSTWKPKIARIWAKSQTAAEWRLPLALFICALLAYAAAYAWHMLTTFDLINLIRDVNYDDSFYYFQIAYNLSQGKFSTFDGGITQTNGYHPVWLLLITPFYWLFDKETALFGIKAFEIALIAGGAALIALAAWLARLAWLLLFAALPTLYRNPHELLYGLEAAAAMFTLSLLILAVCLYMRDPPRWKWPLAAIAFALPWARIEYIAISLAATGALLAIEWSRQERRSPRLSELAKLWNAYIPLIGAAAGILVYFAYNRLVFGGALPISATTRQAWSQDLWAQDGGYDFVQSLQGALQFAAFDYELLIAFEICAYLLIAWWFALRSNDRRGWLLLAFMVGVFGLAAGHIAKFAQSVLTMHPDHASQIWYFVPAYMTDALIIPIRLYVAIWLIRRFIAPRRSAAANLLAIGVFVGGAAVLLARADFAYPFKWVDEESRATYREHEITAYMGAQVLNRALPEGSVIGSWDAGVLGYFSRFPVVNMDGYVNSYDHFHTRHIQRMEGLNFYLRYGVTHFANNLQPANVPNNVIFEGASIDKPHIDRQFRVWTYDTPTDSQDEIYHSHWVWERMKPHFAYSSNDVGIVLDGRMAQAFVKNCAPDNSLAWTWQENEEPVETETNLYPGLTAICVDTRVLPRSAQQPVQAKIAPTSDYFVNLLTSKSPAIRSDFDVYHIDRRLIYAKPQCSQEDVAARFFVSVFPVDANDLTDNHKQRSYDSIEFNIEDHGAIADDGMCWTEVDLPDYPIAEIHTGQYLATAEGYDYSWEAAYKVAVGAISADGVAPDFRKLAGNEPVIRSDFDVHLLNDSLIYTKQQCSEADAAARFFVSVFPAYANSLPAYLRQTGYGSLEFKIDDRNITADGKCWAEVLLPDYLIAKVHTGQYAATADGYDYLWEVDIYRIGVDPDFERLDGSKPIIRSAFDVYLIDRSLIYTKQQCGEEDATARFFVSVFPVDADALSDDRRQYGYDAIEFNFDDYGSIAADGQCWTEVDLPGYPIDAIHTGQYLVVADGYHYPWESSYKFGVGSYSAGAGPDFERLRGYEPVIRSDFDVYLIDRSLIYTKSQCSKEDMAARFFLGVLSTYVNHPPEHTRQIGYSNMEFKIDEQNATADGNCWAEVLLQDYLIVEIHTGQYAATADGYAHIWEDTYRFNE